jgi:hypothetical protein
LNNQIGLGTQNEHYASGRLQGYLLSFCSLGHYIWHWRYGVKQRLLFVCGGAAFLAALLLLGACTPKAGAVSGVVVDKDGKPVENASVVTVPKSSSATTGKDGKFTLNLAPGDYTLDVSATGLNAVGQKVTVKAGASVSASLTLEPEAPFPLGSVRAVSASGGDKEVLPDNQVAITLTAGYGTSNNNLIVTSGLNNVPVGTYVYLQGKTTDERGEKITAWEWTVVGPREKAITVENASTRLPRFKADAEGKYEVTISVTKEKGGKASSSFEVNAGRYVGVQTCATCHSGSVMPDVVSEWKETGHGDKFQGTYASYSAKSDYCLRCHTVGYDETSKAGGFADAAKQAGWTPDKGSVAAWLKGNNWTIDQVLKSPMGTFANIQCENCHGPGSVHTGALSYEPGVCTQCHGQELQWRNSGHAATGAANLHTAEGDCVACHTGQGFVAVKVRGLEPVQPNQAIEGKPANLPAPGSMSPVACATCHDPHAFTEPFDKGSGNIASLQLRITGKVTMPNGVTVDARESAVCVSCHADKRDLTYKADYSAGKNARGAHGDTQADVFYGITSAVFDFNGPKYASSVHPAVVDEGCISCHMAANPAAPKGATADNVSVTSSHGALIMLNVGGHSWNMEAEYNGQTIANTAACTSCHKDLATFNRTAVGDYDGDGKVEGVQDEVDGLLKLVADKLAKDASGKMITSVDAKNTTELQRQALWNYNVIANDGSRGVHNTAFAVQVLQRTYKALTGKDVPGATIR